MCSMKSWGQNRLDVPRGFLAGMLEWHRSHRQDGGLIANATSRIDRSMDVAVAKEAEDDTDTDVLADVTPATDAEIDAIEAQVTPIRAQAALHALYEGSVAAL